MFKEKKGLSEIKTRLYTTPGLIVSAFVSLVPSFTLSALVLRMFRMDVDLSATVHFMVRFVVLGRLTIGPRSTVNAGCFIDNRMGVTVGSDSMIGRKCCIYTLGHDNNNEEFKSVGASVIIGNNVVIYPHSIIMPGVKIGDNAVIYPGSVVAKDVMPNCIVAGVPAIKKGHRQVDKPYMLKYRTYFGV